MPINKPKMFAPVSQEQSQAEIAEMDKRLEEAGAFEGLDDLDRNGINGAAWQGRTRFFVNVDDTDVEGRIAAGVANGLKSSEQVKGGGGWYVIP